MSEGPAGNNFTVNRGVGPADPTPLTTEQILRENAWVEKVFKSELDAIKATLAAMEKALELVQAKADRQPSPREVQLQVEALAAVKAEHWHTIDKELAAISTLANQMSSSSKEAITAAFSAYKDAAAKSEDNLDKRITQQAQQSATSMSVLDVTIGGVSKGLASLEGRVVAIESRRAGESHEKVSQQTNLGTLIGVAGLVVAIVVAAMALFNR